MVYGVYKYLDDNPRTSRQKRTHCQTNTRYRPPI